jgi:hypothetical protein
MAATVARVTVMRSAGASSISRPRRPALQNIVVPSASADSSSTVGSLRRWPTGEMPPVT